MTQFDAEPEVDEEAEGAAKQESRRVELWITVKRESGGYSC